MDQVLQPTRQVGDVEQCWHYRSNMIYRLDTTQYCAEVLAFLDVDSETTLILHEILENYIYFINILCA